MVDYRQQKACADPVGELDYQMQEVRDKIDKSEVTTV